MSNCRIGLKIYMIDFSLNYNYINNSLNKGFPISQKKHTERLSYSICI